MKKKVILFLISAFSFSNAFSLFGPTKHVLKINVPPLLFNVYSVQYEHPFLRNFSWCVQAGYSNGLSLGTYINRVMDSKQNILLDKIKSNMNLKELYTTQSLYLTPEVRVYISRKGAPKGFYLAPYLRLSRSMMNAKFIYKDSNNVEKSILFSGHINGFNPGIMVGYQKVLLRHIVIDFWFGGVQFGSSTATLTANGDYTGVEKQGVTDFIQNNMKYGSATANFNNSNASIDYKGKSASYRLGLCVGFCF